MKEIKIGSDFSGIGALNQSLKDSSVKYVEVFACEMDKFARKTFLENNGTAEDIELSRTKEHDYICDTFSKMAKGKEVFKSGPDLEDFYKKADAFAKAFSFYYPFDVYHRDIPADPLGLYVTTPPCQGFSMAGQRKGSILFLNSLEFIKINKPEAFVFENVKGLLSHEKTDKDAEYGKTFNLWLNYLGGKSVNGNPVVFPFEDSVPYHIYHTVLNAKDFGIPQNRERVFIVGIRDDEMNNFRFPIEQQLKNKLIGFLDSNVPEKYYLSVEMVSKLVLDEKPLNQSDILKIGFINQDTQASKVFSESSPTISAGTHGYANGYVEVSKEVRTEEAKEIRKKTKSGKFRNKKIEFRKQDFVNTITCTLRHDHFIKDPVIAAMRGRNIDDSDVSNIITTVTKDNLLVEPFKIGTWRTYNDGNGFREIKDNVCPTIPARAREDGSGQPVIKSTSFIRRLTPRECIRLMGFPDSLKLPCSDTQTYKQAGNSVVVAVYKALIKRIFKIN